MSSLLSYLPTAIDSLPPHTYQCDPESGKPSIECDRCILEGIGRELELANERLDQYRAAGAISALEVMPSDAAVARMARALYSREHGSCSTAHHRALMAEYDAHGSTVPAVWLTQARELLRHAAGLPAALVPPTPRSALFRLAAAKAIADFTAPTEPLTNTNTGYHAHDHDADHPALCEVCQRPTRQGSVYCSDACERIITGELSHAEQMADL